MSRGKIVKVFDHYLREGGFPEVVGCDTLLEKRQLLQTYYRTLYYRDVLERYHIRAKALLEMMMSYCLDAFAETFSISAFAKRLKQNGMTGSKRTIANYLHYLSDAFFLIVNEKFAYSPTRRIMNPRKIYLLDSGFAFLSTSFSENRGKILENAVAIEMLRRRYDMFYFKENRECDFVIKEGTRPAAAVQVCWELTPRNEKRETAGLQEAMTRLGLSRGSILTYNQTSQIQMDDKRVPVLPAWRWVDQKPTVANRPAV
ncbi:ATP-binding protein [Acidobacteriota bacterium]